MMVGARVSIIDANLMVLGTKILSHVPDNVFLTPASGDSLLNGAFIKFKLWWMTQRMSSSGEDIPFETQFMIAKRNDASPYGETNGGAMSHSEIYTVLLPILEGDFRAVLQGNENDDLEICLESGDPAVHKFEGTHLVFLGAGSDLFRCDNKYGKV